MGISARKVAAALGVSHPAVLKKAEQGKIPREKDGTFNLNEVRKAWVASTDPSRGRNAVTGHPRGLQNGDGERLLKIRENFEAARAALMALNVQQRRGELVSADEVKTAAFEEGRRVRDQVLAVPDRVSAVFAGMMDAEEIHAYLTAELAKALEELSGFKS
ncbi:MAG: hypothetical protein A3J75_05010 [Acidobacteria bacterium RBG_16_68_9]|nr:MAG: hypothetical protein A3J75_05010 [Acidobacteria bacterium RBG_16_68_9]